ncbi:MAG TPA: hypothetical protein VFO63_03985 [Blastocatellia bacterium]|nr:hypothetical protein [Blastocatellia bacterium]
MNCQEFEASINDLARDQIMDAASRARALAHSEGCAECAARLADERMLSAGLRYLAASASTEQAPARIESALLAAFRERNATVSAPTVPAPVVTPINGRRLSRWAIAAAAAILILIALVALRANQSLPEPPKQAKETQVAPDVASPAPGKESPKKKEADTPVTPRRNLQNYAAANRPRRAAPRAEAVNAKDAEAVNAKDAAAGDYEITTDFIPLNYRGRLADLEGGQVLRVELPRSSLASFGLPVNLERAGERIKADVVVGNDGMARAIRFVR